MSAIEELQSEWDFLLGQGALLALLPIEKWLADLEHADTVGPIVDPTLYRNYLYSGKGELLKKLFRGALAFKYAVLEAQKQLADEKQP